MSFSTREKQIIRNTYWIMLPIAETVAKTFYRRLFDMSPEMRLMFEPMTTQELHRQFVQTLTLAVRALENPDELVSTAQVLGHRLVEYGVREEHYGIVGSTFLWTMRRTLEHHFPPHVESAWTKLYVLVLEAALSAYALQAEMS